MISKTRFRALLIATWVLALAAYAVRSLDANSIPANVRDAVYAANAGGLPFSVEFYYLLSYVYFFLFLAATTGLFIFKNRARHLYLIYYAAGYALGLVPPLTVYARPYYVVAGLFSLSSTLIAALIFFSPVKDYFNGAQAGQLR